MGHRPQSITPCHSRHDRHERQVLQLLPTAERPCQVLAMQVRLLLFGGMPEGRLAGS